MIYKLDLYIQTLRHLKFSQIFWRLWYQFTRPHINYSLQPPIRSIDGNWVVPAHRRQSLYHGDTFSFLNETGRLSEIGWEGPEREKLWRYNQHYFDELNSTDAALRTDWHHSLIKSWISENKPGKGTGWEPYPTSLRIVNWVKWFLAGHTLDDCYLKSLAVQTRFLSQRIEWHICGNHLFSNAKAMVFAGLFFRGPEAQQWLKTGLDIITQELPEQVLPDGGNFERSPMYHSIFLEDLLDLINLAGAYPGEIQGEYLDQLHRTSIKMLIWLSEMCHPDSEITFFNDAAMGIAPTPLEIDEYARRLGLFVNKERKVSTIPVIKQFTDSGYIRLDAIHATAFLDVAPIGPDYLPGHAHADTLSFELSLFGERVLVNCGTSQYGSGQIRQDERGTKAHNTVVINSKNSSEVWSGFRVARRAYPRNLVINQEKKAIFVSCAHDGYKRLQPPVIHKRSWQIARGKLVICDRVYGKFETAIARFHIHPNIKMTVISPCKYLLHLPVSGQEVQLLVLKGVAQIQESFFSPEFGIRLNSQCLSVLFGSNTDIAVEISWSINE